MVKARPRQTNAWVVVGSAAYVLALGGCEALLDAGSLKEQGPVDGGGQASTTEDAPGSQDSRTEDAPGSDGGRDAGTTGGESGATDSGRDEDAAGESSLNSAAQLVVTGLAFTATEALPVSGPIGLVTDVIASDSATALSATIDWGDEGPTSYGSVSGSAGSFSIAGSHTYASSGSFTVTLTVGAPDAAQGVTTFAATVQPPVTTTGYTIPTAESGPGFIAAGPDGALWFVESANKIGRVTTSGSFSEFMIPTANASAQTIIAGPDGNLWFCESSTDKIGQITTQGTITEFNLAAGSGPGGITVGPDHNLWFTETNANKIGGMTPTGTVFDEFAITTPGSQSFSITSGPDGNLWFVEYFGNNVGRMSISGALQEFPIAGSTPGAIIAGPGGDLWLTENGGDRVDRMTTGAVVTRFAVPAPDDDPLRLTTGPDGNVWFTFQSTSSQLGRVTPTGAFTEFPIASVGDIVQGADGNLWFTDPADNQIVRLVITP